MAYKKIFSETETDPAEYEPEDAVECFDCGEVYDRDDDDIIECDDGEFRGIDCYKIREEDDDY